MAFVPSSFVCRLCSDYSWYLWLLTKCYSFLNWTHTYMKLHELVYQCSTSTSTTCVRLCLCVYMNKCAHVVPITLPLYVCVVVRELYKQSLYCFVWCTPTFTTLPQWRKSRTHAHTQTYTHTHTQAVPMRATWMIWAAWFGIEFSPAQFMRKLQWGEGAEGGRRH